MDLKGAPPQSPPPEADDATDRAQGGSAESEIRLQAIVDAAAEGINVLDLRTGRYVFMSPAQVAMTGFTLEEINEISAEEALERCHPDDRHISAEQQARIVAGESDLGVAEYRWRVKSGEYRWFRDSRRVLRDQQGEPYALVGVSTDITDDVELREALRRAEVESRTLAENSPDIVFLIDRDMRLRNANTAYHEALRASGAREIAVGERHSIDDFTAETRSLWRAWYERAFAGETVSAEYDFVTVEGDRREERVYFRPVVAEDGTVTGVVVTSRDVTTEHEATRLLQASEEQFRRLFETMDQGVVFQDAEGSIVAANPAAERILGLSLEQMLGRTSADPRWHAVREDGSPLPGEEHPITVARLTGRPVHGVLVGVRNEAEDSTRWILIDAVPQFRPGEERPYQTFAVFTDVTRQRRLEDQLRGLNEALERRVRELEATSRELEAFVYSAAHDLRAPLRAIDGFSQMIVEDAAARLDEADREHLARVRAAAQRMGLLIDHLMALARAGRQELRRERIDVSALAAQVCAEVCGEPPRRPLELVIAPGLEAEADPVLLRTVLTNLLENAW